MVLLVGAVFFPFLEVSAMGFGNASSLFDVALAFATGFCCRWSWRFWR